MTIAFPVIDVIAKQVIVKPNKPYHSGFIGGN